MTHGSLFSGIEGFGLGAAFAGIKTIWSCEFEDYQTQIIKKNFGENHDINRDIRTYSSPSFVDIISGGFPCQDISVAGKGVGITGSRSGLWTEMYRIVGEVRPNYIIFENSQMLTIRGFERVLCDLSEIGYDCEWQCLYATQFGYNHRRERIYGIANSRKKRCKNNTQIFKPIRKILSTWTPRQVIVPMPIKRFDSASNYERVRMDDGFSSELDSRRIEDCGNAVIPEIAKYIFECIIEFDKTFM